MSVRSVKLIRSFRAVGYSFTSTKIHRGTVFRRSIHVTAWQNRGDYLSRYIVRPPFPRGDNDDSLSLSEDKGAEKVDRKGSFETVSTEPAATSFQATPPPSVDARTVITNPVPAMVSSPTIPISQSEAGPVFIEGIKIPPKPRSPGEEECCMSGCVHCVYTIYADELTNYTEALESARSALQLSGKKQVEWPDVVRNMDDVGSKEAKNQAMEKVMEAVDPAMAAFLALENKLKKKQAPEASPAS